jgi:hypothetical protein
MSPFPHWCREHDLPEASEFVKHTYNEDSRGSIELRLFADNHGQKDRVAALLDRHVRRLIRAAQDLHPEGVSQ